MNLKETEERLALCKNLSDMGKCHRGYSGNGVWKTRLVRERSERIHKIKGSVKEDSKVREEIRRTGLRFVDWSE